MTAKMVSPKNSKRINNPGDWITGDEAMTGGARVVRANSAEEAHETVEPDLTKPKYQKRLIV